MSQLITTTVSEVNYKFLTNKAKWLTEKSKIKTSKQDIINYLIDRYRVKCRRIERWIYKQSLKS